VICIDTNVLIWGVQGVAQPAQEGMIDRTRRYLAQLARDNEQVMVPSVVVSEYLQGFPLEEHPAQIEALAGGFFVAAFDARCAALAAELQRIGPAARAAPGSRIALKADCQIIATAISHGASRIVTNNLEEFRRIARDRIPVIDVPETWEQPDMLVEAPR
jgi:predicted nucleic acid-binding protein